MEVPDPEALLGATIALDFRPVFGDRALAAGLAARVAALAPSRPRFLTLLARHALARAAPLGVLGRLAVATGGAHPGTIDLKLQGVALFVDAARVLALAHGALARGTADRLREVGARGALCPEDVAASIDALGFVQGLRLRHQCELAAAGRPLDNRVAPAALHAVDRSFLKEALRQARKLQNRLAADYLLRS
jgi:CBS domain-containing protein